MFYHQHFDQHNLHFPDQIQINRIEGYVHLLQPLYQVSLFLEGEKYVTLPYLPYFVDAIFTYLQPQEFELPAVAAVHASLLQECERRFHWILTVANEALLAAALHPIHGHLSFISIELRDEVWRLLKSWCIIIYGGANVQPDIFGEDGGNVNYFRLEELNQLRKRFEHPQHHLFWPFH